MRGEDELTMRTAGWFAVAACLCASAAGTARAEVTMKWNGEAGAPVIFTRDGNPVAKAVMTAAAPVPPVGESRPIGDGDVITQTHLALFTHGAGDQNLCGYTESAAYAAEAAAYWSPLLRSQGVKVEPPRMLRGAYILPYATPDGRLIRSFVAEPEQFPTGDEAALRANMAVALGALRDAGLTPLSARVLKIPRMATTYSLLYLTDAGQSEDHERRLRTMESDSELDEAVFAAGGVTLVRTPKPSRNAYIGPAAGHEVLEARTPEQAERLKMARVEALRLQGRRTLAARVSPPVTGRNNFRVDIYFVADASR